MKDKFNLKKEILFVSLASHAKHIVDNKVAYDISIVQIARLLLKHFSKKSKRYTVKQSLRLKEELSQHYEPILQSYEAEVDVLMLCQMLYLFEEGHKELIFTLPFKRYAIYRDVYYLESLPETNGYVKDANKLIGAYLYGEPSKHSTSIRVSKIKEYNRTIMDSYFYLFNKNNLSDGGNLDISLYNYLTKDFTDDDIYRTLILTITNIGTIEAKNISLEHRLNNIHIENNDVIIKCNNKIKEYIGIIVNKE